MRPGSCFMFPAENPSGGFMGSVVKKRRKKISKHKHRKMLKKTRWQRRHK